MPELRGEWKIPDAVAEEKSCAIFALRRGVDGRRRDRLGRGGAAVPGARHSLPSGEKGRRRVNPH